MTSLMRCITGYSVAPRLFKKKITNIGVRFLYNEQFLGIDKYIEARQRTISRLGNMRENFYRRMKAQMNSTIPSMIFTEDLKTVFHSCEDKDEEVELCVQMMKKFHKQNKELRFGTFIFGPVGMRLFYYLKKKDLMYDFFKDPELDGFFDQLKSYLLTMDICFKNEMYKEILESFEDLKSKRLTEGIFPREAMVLATAACYKLNTPEMFQYASDLVTQAREAKLQIIRKALTFVVALALKQNKPDVALEILSNIDRFNNITGNNLKLMAFAGLDRMQDAFDILRRITDQDAPVQSRIRGEICQATLDALQKSVDRIDDKETSHIFEQICRSLKESNSITNQTIDELVCAPIEPRQFLREGDNVTLRQRNRFPDQLFRPRERENMDGDEPYSRRRRFAGLSDEY